MLFYAVLYVGRFLVDFNVIRTTSPALESKCKSFSGGPEMKRLEQRLKMFSRPLSAVMPARAPVKTVSRLADTLVSRSNPAAVAAWRRSGRALGCSGKAAARRRRVPEEMRLHSSADL